MRVLLITWACDIEDVSEPQISAIWVRELSKDHDLTVFTISKPERYGCVKQQFPEVDVIEWKDIRVPRSLERFRAVVKPGYWSYYIRARYFLKRLLREKHFDIIHHLSPFAWRYPSPAVRLGVPLVRGPVAGGLQTPSGLTDLGVKRFHPFMFLRKTDSFRMQFDPLLRSSYRHIDYVLMAAPYMQDLLKPLAIKSYSIEIEHGLTELPKPGKNDSPKHSSELVQLLYVGRVIPTKGLRYAIRALALLPAQLTIKLSVIGDGEDLTSCKREVERLGLQGKVQFVGWCTTKEVEQYYRQADIFLFPSYREPTGGVLLEAMAHGLPCITCAYGGPDYLVDNSCGIKVPIWTEEQFVTDLCASIVELVSDKNLREKMSKKAILRAEEEFGWRAKSKRIEEIYVNVVNDFKAIN